MFQKLASIKSYIFRGESRSRKRRCPMETGPCRRRRFHIRPCLWLILEIFTIILISNNCYYLDLKPISKRNYFYKFCLPRIKKSSTIIAMSSPVRSFSNRSTMSWIRLFDWVIKNSHCFALVSIVVRIDNFK